MRPVKATEKEYARALKKIARQAAHIVDIYADGAVISNPAAMMAELIKYANIIEPWANRVGGKMIASTAASVERMIKSQSREISAGLKEYLKTSSGQVALALQREQVMLIKSLPIEAGKRAQKLAMDAVVGGRRPAEVAAEIMRTEEVTTSRAMLIARTESAKASAVITQERAKGIGATHYIWRTAQDSDVRESHAEMEGEVCAYDDPPIVDGEPLNPGEIYNCFVGSTKVSLDSGARKLIRSGYTGKVVSLFAGAVNFTATPNHPILTQRGWIAAGDIKRGDYIVQVVSKSGIMGENKNHDIPTFDDAFAAFALRGKAQLFTGSSFDFYGDVPDGNVDVIPIDFSLPSNVMTKFLQRVCNFTLSKAYGWIVDRVIRGGFFHVVKPFFSGLCNKLYTLIGGHCSHPDVIGLTAIPSSNAVFAQDSGYSSSVASIPDGQSELAVASRVLCDYLRLWKFKFIAPRRTPDNIDTNSLESLAQECWVASDGKGGVFNHSATEYQFLRVEDSVFADFSGHVYTLETNNGWYSVTDGMVVSKNCRCYAEVIIPD